MTTELVLRVPQSEGYDGFFDLRDQINDFVKKNFNLLYSGAVRLDCEIVEDYFAGRRIQINNTRLHYAIGLKYANGHKYSDCNSPTEKQLRQTISDIQQLLDAAAETIRKPFTLEIIESDK